MSGVTVSGSLTFEELQVICRDNVGYESDASLAKATRYIDAMRALLTWALTESEHAGERVNVDPRVMSEQLAKAERWRAIAQSRATPLPVFQPAECWRDE